MILRVKIDEKVFEVEVKDLSARPIVAMVDGESFEIWPEESTSEIPDSAPVVQAAAPAAPVARPARPAVQAPMVDSAAAIKAPIPGVIIAVAIKEGEEVKQGQEVCTLEAMKMKNAIRAPRAGKIGRLHVGVGDHVKHGQALMEYAE